jgi:lysophospholipase L1-like esterase
MRIAFLGASLTEGSYGGSYVNALRGRLTAHTLLNHGVNGSTLNRLLERVDAVLDDSPDVVFILAGSNDAIAYAAPKTRGYYRKAQDLPDGFIEPHDFAQMYRDLLTRFQLAHVQAVVGLPPLEYNPAVAEAARTFNAAATEAARAFNLPVCDLYTPLMPAHIPDRRPLDLNSVMLIGERVKSGWHDYDMERLRGGYTYSFDGIHFTPQTAERAAQLIAGCLHDALGLDIT